MSPPGQRGGPECLGVGLGGCTSWASALAYPPDEEDAPTSSGGRRVNVGLEGETVKKVKYFVEDEPTSPLLASAGSPPAPARPSPQTALWSWGIGE